MPEIIMNFCDSPPSIKQLKNMFLDKHEACSEAPTLHCVAHMILEIDSPKELVRIALEYLVAKFKACRADAGFSTPSHKEYTPISESRSNHTAPPSIIGIRFPNQHPILQTVWRSEGSVFFEEIDYLSDLDELSIALQQARCKSMLMHRLEWDNKLIGISCIDYTCKSHKWSKQEIDFMHQFCTRYFGPLAGISNHWFNPKLHTMFSKPSPSELEAVRLAAKGLTYKQIAGELNKSIRTIENQFRNARSRLSAKNLIDLIKKCEQWL